MIVTDGDIRRKPDLAAAIKDTAGAWLASPELAAMREAYKYYLGENPRIKGLAERVATDTGFSINLAPQQRVYSNFFGKITNQHVGHLLKHPLKFDAGVIGRLGAGFQHTVRDMAQDAYIRGVSWGLWNGERLTHIRAENFVPIRSEESGELAAGLGFYRLRDDMPYVYYFYEPEGVTQFRQAVGADGKALEDGGPTQVGGRMPYRYTARRWRGGEQFERLGGGSGVPPIKPLYTNKENRSELILPLKTKINAYDLLETAYVDEALKSKFIYWVISGYSGNIEELVKVKETVQKIGVMNLEGETTVQPQTLEPPHAAHTAVMQELRDGIYADAMAFNSDDLGGRASVAVEAIRASQFNEEIKIGIMWHELEKFIRDVLALAGVESATVGYTPFMLKTGEEALSRSLQAWVDRGLPLLEALRLDPLVSANIDADELAGALALGDYGVGE